MGELIEVSSLRGDAWLKSTIFLGFEFTGFAFDCSLLFLNA